MDVLDHWFFMAMMTPLIWAVCCLLDIGFVCNRIYKIAMDGPVISGLFSILPVLMVVATGSLPDNVVELSAVTHPAHLTAMLAGAAYFLHIYFYFKVDMIPRALTFSYGRMAKDIITITTFI